MTSFVLSYSFFFGRHPHTRFGRLAIVHTLNAPRLSIERALRRLVSKGLVKIYVGENAPPFYSLTDVEPLSRLVPDLAKLNWCQWQRALERLGVYETETKGKDTE